MYIYLKLSTHRNSTKITGGEYTVYICYIQRILAKSQHTVFPGHYSATTTDILLVFSDPLFVSRLRILDSQLKLFPAPSELLRVVPIPPPSTSSVQCLKLTRFRAGANARSAVDLVRRVLYKTSRPLEGTARMTIANLGYLVESTRLWHGGYDSQPRR